ncbi:uncharacterized protein LOC123313641 [Coccinella septempunctata]|uniref:uncharacterized protein LOC123313641 n=1 Tax=Coccinella septempunctata TaxID=41139 RepID=UPI001D08466A|nr:uncharacterized protein LOC123313641 [Coccinella septempunctata]
MLYKKFITAVCMVLLLILTANCLPRVGSSSNAENNSFLLDRLDNLRDEVLKTDWTPEELKFLGYSDLLEKARERYYAANWPYFILPRQNKMKKNSEMSRGMYNALNNIDLYNAGR